MASGVIGQGVVYFDPTDGTSIGDEAGGEGVSSVLGHSPDALA